jgi:hypothetical protein
VDLFVKTVTFHPAGSPHTPKFIRWRGCVLQRSSRAVVVSCPHAHRSGIAAHKCGVKLMNVEWAKSRQPGG